MPRKEFNRYRHNQTSGNNGKKADARRGAPLGHRQSGCRKWDCKERRNIRRCRDALRHDNRRNRHRRSATSAATLSGTATFRYVDRPTLRRVARKVSSNHTGNRLSSRTSGSVTSKSDAVIYEISLYDALHHRFNGVVRYFVIEARAVAVGSAAEMFHLDRGIRWLTAAYEV